LDFLERPVVGLVGGSLAVLAFLFVVLVLGQASLLAVGFLVISSAEVGWYGNRFLQERNTRVY